MADRCRRAYASQADQLGYSPSPHIVAVLPFPGLQQVENNPRARVWLSAQQSLLDYHRSYFQVHGNFLNKLHSKVPMQQAVYMLTLTFSFFVACWFPTAKVERKQEASFIQKSASRSLFRYNPCLAWNESHEHLGDFRVVMARHDDRLASVQL